MNAALSGLAWPPSATQLTGFPTTPAPSVLHRLSDHPNPWWYASRPSADEPGTGRFDLPAPDGTCYFAGTLEGALLEKTLRRPRRIVALDRLTELYHARVDVRGRLPLADLADPEASGFGINAEVHTTLDYAKSNAWALALRRSRHRGLRYLLRSDPALRLLGIGLFGRAGLYRRAPTGLRTSVSGLDTATAVALLERRGAQVVPIPIDVPTVAPPD